jgi:hypothetical protein
MLLIALFVSSDFRQPILSVRKWFSAAINTFLAAVPEAAMNEYASVERWKDKVRFAWQRCYMQAVAETSLV